MGFIILFNFTLQIRGMVHPRKYLEFEGRKPKYKMGISV